MKKITFISIMTLLVFSQCTYSGKKENQLIAEQTHEAYSDKVYHIDHTKKYKEKNYIIQDYAQVTYVKLATNDECLIDNINRIVNVKMTDDDIFLALNNDFFRFDKNGSFLNRIGKKGQGPEEYVSISSFVIHGNEILVTDDTTRRILVYSFDGNLIRFIETDLPVSQIEIIDEHTLACCSHYIMPGVDNPAFTIRSVKNGEILKILSQSYEKGIGSFFLGGGFTKASRKNKRDILFNTSFTDTIFSVNKNDRIPRYILLPPNNGSTIHNNDLSAGIFLMCETDLFSNIHIFDKDLATTIKSFVIDKQEQTVYSGFLIDNDYCNMIYPIHNGIDNQFITFYEIDKLKERAEKGLLKNKLKEITENSDDDDNPILMIATLK